MTSELIPIQIAVFIFGLVIGSFLNVCIYRIPKKEGLVITRSHCVSCGYQLRWYDLVPVFSWMALGGNCRNCKAKISVQYPLVELTNGILYIIIVGVAGYLLPNQLTESLLYCLLASALLVLSIIDIRTREIPFGINVFIGILGLIRVGMDYRNWYVYVIGFFAVSLFLELVLLFTGGRAIGGGDVKLMAVAGLCLGWQKIVLAFVLACIIGSVVHLSRMKICKSGHELAMGPYLSVGIFLAAMWGREWIRLYLDWLFGS